MKTLTVKAYNTMQTRKWSKNYNECLELIKLGERHLTELPQLAFYVFNKSYGYVAFNSNSALWNKSKKGVISFWNSQYKQ
jgi:hypothetical protein